MQEGGRAVGEEGPGELVDHEDEDVGAGHAAGRAIALRLTSSRSRGTARFGPSTNRARCQRGGRRDSAPARAGAARLEPFGQALVSHAPPPGRQARRGPGDSPPDCRLFGPGRACQRPSAAFTASRPGSPERVVTPSSQGPRASGFSLIQASGGVGAALAVVEDAAHHLVLHVDGEDEVLEEARRVRALGGPAGAGEGADLARRRSRGRSRRRRRRGR